MHAARIRPRPAISQKFVETDAGYINTRLELERANALEIRKKAAENGKQGAEKRWHGNGQAMGQPSPSHGRPIATPMPRDSTPSPSLSLSQIRDSDAGVCPPSKSISPARTPISPSATKTARERGNGKAEIDGTNPEIRKRRHQAEQLAKREKP